MKLLAFLIIFSITILFFSKLTLAKIYIPQKPYDVYNLVLGLHDVNPSYTKELYKLENFLEEMEKYTGHNRRKWNNFRFTLFVMPSCNTSCGLISCIGLNSSKGFYLRYMSKYHSWEKGSSTEFAYHPQCGGYTACDLSKDKEFERMKRDLEEFYDAFGFNFTSIATGWFFWDWYTLVNLQKIGVFVDESTTWNNGYPYDDFRGSQIVGYPYWDKIINKTDETNSEFVRPRPIGTLNFSERADKKIFVVHIPNHVDLESLSILQIQKEIVQSKNKKENMFVGYIHIYAPSWEEKLKSISKWFWDNYAKNGNGRFGTYSEVGYQFLANASIKQNIVVNNSTHLIYNLSSTVPKIYWFSLAIPRNEIKGKKVFFVSSDNGKTWKKVYPTKNSDKFYWFELEIRKNLLFCARKSKTNYLNFILTFLPNLCPLCKILSIYFL